MSNDEIQLTMLRTMHARTLQVLAHVAARADHQSEILAAILVNQGADIHEIKKDHAARFQELLTEYTNAAKEALNEIARAEWEPDDARWDKPEEG